MAYYDYKTGPHKGKTGPRYGPSRDEKKPPLFGRREFLLAGLGLVTGVAAAQPMNFLPEGFEIGLPGFPGSRQMETAVHWLLFDNTDRAYLTEFQRTALQRMILEADKQHYGTGTKIVAGTFTSSEFDPVHIHFEQESPGNGSSANAAWQTGSKLEEEWRVFEPRFSAAVNQGLTAASQPEATHLFAALERAYEHGRRSAGPDGTLIIKPLSDLLVHVPGGMSAYVSETNSRHPKNAIARLPSTPFEGSVQFKIVAIRRDGRKTRSGRDLGEVQRKLAPLVVSYLRGRGANVELTWV